GSIVAYGLGSSEKLDSGSAFSAGVALGKKLCVRSRRHVAVALPEAGDPASIASALLEGLIVSTQGPDLRKTERSRHPFETLSIVTPEESHDAIRSAAFRGKIVGEAVNLARELVNTPPAEKIPTTLATRARVVGEAAGLTVQVWDKSRIEGERFGGL